VSGWRRWGNGCRDGSGDRRWGNGCRNGSGDRLGLGESICPRNVDLDLFTVYKGHDGVRSGISNLHRVPSFPDFNSQRGCHWQPIAVER
jgi:hypothetical protein